jgi:hypothetical protein
MKRISPVVLSIPIGVFIRPCHSSNTALADPHDAFKDHIDCPRMTANIGLNMARQP